jgi:hypothetical protein
LIAVAPLSIGAAVIHYAVVAQHLDEWWLTGLFFISLGLFQLTWGILVLKRPSQLLWAGAVANALAVAVWIISRTRGVPLGPEAGHAEPVGLPDALATAFEVGIVATVAALLLSGRGARRLSRLRANLVGWGLAAAVMVLTALALVSLA